MIDVPLAAVPNQSLTIQLDGSLYVIALRDAGQLTAVTITRDDVVLVSGLRVTAGTPLLPYRYQESGNFVLTTENEEIPQYPQFGVTQFLVYVTPAELAEFRAA